MTTSTNEAKNSGVEILVYLGLSRLVKGVDLPQRRLMLLTLEAYMLCRKILRFFSDPSFLCNDVARDPVTRLGI